MLKWLGALIIIGASTAIGFSLAARLVNRTKQVRQLQKCLELLETQIVYGSIPLEVAFEKLAHSQNGRIGQLFERCVYYFKSLDGATTKSCWDKAVKDIAPTLAVKQEELDLLAHFGAIIGNSDKLDQQKHLKYMQQQLKHIEKEAHQDALSHAKMYKTLGFLAGITVVIILI